MDIQDSDIISKIIKESETLAHLQELDETYSHDKNRNLSKELTVEDMHEYISDDLIRFYKDESYKDANTLIEVIEDLNTLKLPRLYRAIEILKTINDGYYFDRLSIELQDFYNKTDSTMKYNILLVSHNDRLRCFLIDYFKETLDKTLNTVNKRFRGHGHGSFKEIRFKNACVLKLTLFENKCTFDLIYGGDVTHRKDGCYFKAVNDPEININHRSIDVTFPKTTIDIDDKFEGFNPNIMYNIFIVRHGEAWHNINKIHYKFDTDLTEGEGGGRESVAKTGKFLSNLGMKFDYVFSSPLYRAIQTTQIILEKIGASSENTLIQILKCSNEVKFCTTGKCDNKINEMQNIAPENTSMCNINPRLSKCAAVEEYNIAWDWYRNLKIDCSDTNFVNLILNFISDHP